MTIEDAGTENEIPAMRWSIETDVVVLGAGGAGLFSYMAVLTLILRKTHHFYSDQTIRRIYRGLSILLGIIALGLFFAGAVHVFNGSQNPG